jgi:HEPN domain-containing protein
MVAGRGDYRDSVNAESRIIVAIAKDAHDQMMRTGMAGYFDGDEAKFAQAVGADDRDGGRAWQRMLDQGLLYEHSPRFYRASPALLLLHEETDRKERYRQNKVRRDFLESVAETDEDGGNWVNVTYQEGEEPPAEQTHAAAQVLDYLGLVELNGDLPAIFSVKLRSPGRDLVDDARLMRQMFPVSPTEDEEAHAVVAPDALGRVITSCEQMLKHRGWASALEELGKADNEYRDGDWVNAVRDYYTALESGLKYALHEEGKAYTEGTALGKLAGRAVAAGLIPSAYKSLFAFADAIRSPRSHGAGPNRVGEKVEIGQAEALLIGNLARTLLLYLGNRPQVDSSAE